MLRDNICPSCKSSTSVEEIEKSLDGAIIQYYCNHCKTGWVLNTERATILIFKARNKSGKFAETSNNKSSHTLVKQQHAQKPMVPCPICGDVVRIDYLERHNEVFHKKPPVKLPKREYVPTLSRNAKSKRPMTICPICRNSVRIDRLERHKQKVHKVYFTTSSKLSQKQPDPSDKQPPVYKVNQNHLNKLSEHISNQSGYGEEALNQSFNESRFGDKYVGQSNRDWDGTFGSLPLYDDYSDEASAD